MIQTMSGPNDWLQFYHQNFPNQTLTPSVSDSPTPTPTLTTTTTTAPTTTIIPMGNSSSPASTSTHLGPEGRVSKPTRRRSRASRRTPTTLLNTDTTNFRAMVQQFTGGPSAPFAQSASGLPNLMGFGLGPRPVPPLNPTSLHFQQLQLQQQQQLRQQYQRQNQQQYMYSGTPQGGDDAFYQRLITSNPRPPNNNNNNNNVVTDGVLMEHGHGQGGGGYFPNPNTSSSS